MTITAWHFLRSDRCLGYNDGRKVIVGETLSANGELILCENGMHASRSAFDALKYAPGAFLCRVELSGKILTGDDKLVAEHRKCVAMVDAKTMLCEFARWCALQVIDKWDAPDVVRQYLETGDESLRAAARSAAWDAARDATWASARAAARDAAWDAARASARGAEQEKQRVEFEQRCLALIEESL